jgi:hypothetical protein
LEENNADSVPDRKTGNESECLEFANADSISGDDNLILRHVSEK